MRMDSEKLKFDMHVKNYYHSIMSDQYVQFLSRYKYFIYEGRMKITIFLNLFFKKCSCIQIYLEWENAL